MLTLDPSRLRLARTGFVAHRARAESIHVHSHDTEYEFHFFSEGEGRFLNGSDSVRVPAPSLVFTPSGVEHGIQSLRNGARLSFFYLCFEVEPGLDDAMHSLYESFRRAGFLRMGMDFAPRMDRLVDNHDSRNALLNTSAQHQFLSLLYEIMQRVSAPKAGDSNRYVRQLTRQMRDSVNGRFDLGEAAAELGISKAHLVRVFKRSTGLPPLRYFNRLKMDTAKELLKRTDMPLARIAAELSFCDEFYFSRVFKKYAGISPNHFRRMDRDG
ncbi:AraC family transcriptional regulator [Verrucomicrobiota bacterium]